MKASSRAAILFGSFVAIACALLLVWLVTFSIKNSAKPSEEEYRADVKSHAVQRKTFLQWLEAERIRFDDRPVTPDALDPSNVTKYDLDRPNQIAPPGIKNAARRITFTVNPRSEKCILGTPQLTFYLLYDTSDRLVDGRFSFAYEGL